jgi:hypothetical protein
MRPREIHENIRRRKEPDFFDGCISQLRCGSFVYRGLLAFYFTCMRVPSSYVLWAAGFRLAIPISTATKDLHGLLRIRIIPNIDLLAI